jgi:cytochrome c oxidase subunit 3
MDPIVSDRARNTDQMVVLPSALEDPNRPRPGLARLGLFSLCAAIFAFFLALVFAYIWRSRMPPFWDPIPLPGVLWLSTTIIVASSVTFEIARRLFRKGEWQVASRWLLATSVLAAAFLACQLSGWRVLVREGAFMVENPHASFFYLFTGLHAAHLVGGIVALFVVVMGRSKRREFINSVTYYWHFLGVLWLALFAVLKLVA